MWEMGKITLKCIIFFAGGSGLRLDVWTERKKYQRKEFFYCSKSTHKRTEDKTKLNMYTFFVCKQVQKYSMLFKWVIIEDQLLCSNYTYKRNHNNRQKIIELVCCKASCSRGRTKCKWRNNHSSWLWQNVGSSTTCNSA